MYPCPAVVAQVTPAFPKNGNGQQNRATSASSRTTCQYIRAGQHLPTVIPAAELSNFPCKRAPQATNAHSRASSVFTLTLHESQRSPLAEQPYTLSSLWRLGCCSLRFSFCSAEQRGCLGSPPQPLMPALLPRKPLPRIPAFLEAALNKLCCVFAPSRLFFF